MLITFFTSLAITILIAASIALIIWLWRLATGEIDRAQALHAERLALIEAQARTASALAAQPVPHTYSPRITHTYSPHTSERVLAPAGLPFAAETNSLGLEDDTLPLAGNLVDLAFTPTAERILLGLDAKGTPITVSARQLCHVALVGATGGGKSNLLRLILPQIIAIGGQVVLADPHYAAYDIESDEDWRGIERRLSMTPAIRPGEIRTLLDWAEEELERRLERRRNGERVGPPTFIAYDELPVITDSVKDAMESITRIVREGRKIGLYVIGASQSMLVKAIGGDSSAREAYRTAFYVGGDQRSGSALLDLPQREIAEGKLRTGLAYLRAASSAPAQIVAIPRADNAGIARLLGDGAEAIIDFGDFPKGSTERMYGFPKEAAPHSQSIAWNPPGTQREATIDVVSTASQSQKTISPEEARIVELFRAGSDVAEVVRTLWPEAASGRRYQERSTEVQSVLRRTLYARNT